MKKLNKKRGKAWLRLLWQRLQVFLGYKVWARMQYNRPRFALCVFHGLQMKRRYKTELGAVYYCPKCQRSFMLQCKGNKLIPLEEGL